MSFYIFRCTKPARLEAKCLKRYLDTDFDISKGIRGAGYNNGPVGPRDENIPQNYIRKQD